MGIINVPITKASSKDEPAFIQVNTASPEEGGDITDEVLNEILLQGLKVVLNRGMSKITKESYENDLPAMRAAALKKAQETYEDMKAGNIRITGGKAKKGVPREVMQEAMQQARKYVKQWMKDNGIKLAHVSAKEITAAAKDLVADQPSILEQAKATVEARKESQKGFDLSQLGNKIKVDPKLVAKDEKEKAEAKAQLSAAKAGKIPVRAKPAPQATAH